MLKIIVANSNYHPSYGVSSTCTLQVTIKLQEISRNIRCLLNEKFSPWLKYDYGKVLVFRNIPVFEF